MCLVFGAVGAVFVVDVFQPLVAKVVDLIPKKLGWRNRHVRRLWI